MAEHTAISRGRLAGGLLGAAASGAVAVAAVSGAGAANATCASISGVSSGTGCTSTATSFAIGIGNNTTADASGMFSSALAIGDNATAQTQGGNFNVAIADGQNSIALINDRPATGGDGNVAIAVGSGALPGTGAAAVARGTGNVAVAVGNSGPNAGFAVPNLVAFGPVANQRTFAEAAGSFNKAYAIGDGSRALANGGVRVGVPTSIGNDTAISMGNGANSYAGTIPSAVGTNSPSNQFAFAGSGKNAINTVNP
jgi:hypothetical protein